MNKVCEYQGYYIDYDEETGDEDVLKCKLFTNEGDWEEYCYCDEEERNNCMLYKYSKYIEEKDKEIERLNNIIKEQGLEDKPNYYVKGLEGSLKEYQEEVKRLNNIINKFNSSYSKIIKECEEMINDRFYMNDNAIKYHANRIRDIAKYYIEEPKWQELKGEDKE